MTRWAWNCRELSCRKSGPCVHKTDGAAVSALRRHAKRLHGTQTGCIGFVSEHNSIGCVSAYDVATDMTAVSPLPTMRKAGGA